MIKKIKKWGDEMDINIIIMGLASALGFALKSIIKMKKEIIKNNTDIESIRNDINLINENMKRVNDNMEMLTELKVSIKYIEGSILRLMDQKDK